jgi:hypothetical protein
MYDLRVPFRVQYLKREIEIYQSVYPPLRAQLDQHYQYFIPMMGRVDGLIQDYVKHLQNTGNEINLGAHYHLQLMLIKGELLAMEHFYKKVQQQFILVDSFIPAFPGKLEQCENPSAEGEYSSDKLGALSTEWNALKVSINNFTGALYRHKITKLLLEEEFNKLSKIQK